MSIKISNRERPPKMDHKEVEWQLEAADLDSIEGWLKEHPSAFGLAVVPRKTLELTDTYYDTDDWRFHRAGYALRIRRAEKRVEATMKSLAAAEDSVKRRREISEPLRGGGVRTLQKARGPVGERLRLLAGARNLYPLFEMRTRRRIFELRTDGDSAKTDGLSGEIVVDPTGDIRRKEGDSVSAEEIVVDALGGIHRRGRSTLLGEIALDESKFFGGERSARLSRVEIEVADGQESYDDLNKFVGGLRDSLELRPAETSKFETGLSSIGLSPVAAPDLGATGIDDSMSAGEVAFAILRRHFAVMLAHEPGVRLGEDPEELHDMRVATRRLRATLRLYAEALPKRAERFEKDLHWAADALGDVRDLDVHLERLAEEALVDGNEEYLEKAITALKERRIEARRRMLEVLNSDRYERLVSGFSGMLRRGRSPAPTSPILEVAPELIRRRHKKVRKAARGLTEDSPPEAFHDLRKKGRRLRYALEPLQEIYGKPAKQMIGRLKSVQDDLGEQQDLVVAVGTLRELAFSEDLPPQAVFSIGSMAGRYARDAEQIRSGFLDSKKLRVLKADLSRYGLQKTMNKRAGE
jgi:triphosphatase